MHELVDDVGMDADVATCQPIIHGRGLLSGPTFAQQAGGEAGGQRSSQSSADVDVVLFIGADQHVFIDSASKLIEACISLLSLSTYLTSWLSLL